MCRTALVMTMSLPTATLCHSLEDVHERGGQLVACLLANDSDICRACPEGKYKHMYVRNQ